MHFFVRHEGLDEHGKLVPDNGLSLLGANKGGKKNNEAQEDKSDPAIA